MWKILDENPYCNINWTRLVKDFQNTCHVLPYNEYIVKISNQTSLIDILKKVLIYFESVLYWGMMESVIPNKLVEFVKNTKKYILPFSNVSIPHFYPETPKKYCSSSTGSCRTCRGSAFPWLCSKGSSISSYI